MIIESSAVLPLWMLMAAAFGFMAGEACGHLARIKKYLEQDNKALRDQLGKAHASEEPSTVLSEIRDSIRDNVVETKALHRTLRHQRGAVNDIQQYVMAVSKGAEKLAS
jgi:uncharacterized protein HemX